MKKILTIIMILISFSFQELDYKEIWSKGYVDGWCAEQDYCIEPIIPIPSVQQLSDSTYTRIYHKGFRRGLNDFKKTQE